MTMLPGFTPALSVPDAQAVAFWASGMPATKGSTKAFVVKGRAIVTNDAGPKAKVWASVVADAARDAMRGRLPLTGPVRVEIAFYLPRPKSQLRANGQPKPGAHTHAATKPDVDKLARCLVDSLTGIAFADDAQIARLVASKPYATDGRIGAHVVVATMEASR